MKASYGEYAGVKTLEAKVRHYSVNLIPSAGDKFVVKLFKDGEPYEAAIKQEKTGNRLYLEAEDTSFLNNVFGNHDLSKYSMDIYFPSDSTPDFICEASSGGFFLRSGGIYGRLELSSLSGGIVTQNVVNAASVVFKSNSGVLQAAAVSCTGSADFSTMSGEVRIDKLAAEAARVKTMSGGSEVMCAVCADSVEITAKSGSVRAFNVACPNIMIETMSGEIKARNLYGTSKIGSMSGSINVDFSRLHEKVEINSISGDVICALPAGADVECTSKSGSIRNGVKSGGSVPVRISTMSGMIKTTEK